MAFLYSFETSLGSDIINIQGTKGRAANVASLRAIIALVRLNHRRPINRNYRKILVSILSTWSGRLKLDGDIKFRDEILCGGGRSICTVRADTLQGIVWRDDDC